jgi:hypothetical protein
MSRKVFQSLSVRPPSYVMAKQFLAISGMSFRCDLTLPMSVGKLVETITFVIFLQY